MDKEIQTYKFYPKTWCQAGIWIFTNNKPSQEKMRRRNIRDRWCLPSFQQVFTLLPIYLKVTHWSYIMVHNNNLPELHEYDASGKAVMNTPITLQRWKIRNKWHHISWRTFQHSCLPIEPTEQMWHHATPFCMQHWRLTTKLLIFGPQTRSRLMQLAAVP